MSDSIPKYPRTLHLGQSAGGRSKHCAPLSTLAGAQVVIEEKVDGSHAGLFFDLDGELNIFSRNSILSDIAENMEFRRLGQQANLAIDALWQVLEDRYVLYGEWTFLTHSLFYDSLPVYFLEDDVFDRERNAFLSTSKRQLLLAGLPVEFSTSVAVVARGSADRLCASESALRERVALSHHRTDAWRMNLERQASPRTKSLLANELSEGLYIKHESDGVVKGRYKWIREDFVTGIETGGTHWRRERPLRNLLASAQEWNFSHE